MRIRAVGLASRGMFAWLCVGVALLLHAAPAGAASLIVALGASNTNGKGVSRAQAFPAHLEAMLRAQGIDARVSNQGINGDTTGGMLARLGRAVPNGTKLVILQPGGNDRRKGVGAERAGNIAEIQSRLAARGIPVIMLEQVLSVPSQHIQPDGQHLTPEGYKLIASRLLPQVTAAIGRR
jgi:acyl-CoA thioesterase-1